MDYLHGVVAGHSVMAACCYEYARESPILRAAAKERKQAREGEDYDDLDSRVAISVSNEFNCDWFYQWPWLSIWQCASFPGLPWNQLESGEHEPGERELISRWFQADGIRPLPMTSLTWLNARSVLDWFKEKAEKDVERKIRNIPDPRPMPEAMPLWEKGHFAHAIFDLDFSKTKKRLVSEFEAWLNLPENKGRLEKGGANQIGTTGGFRSRLKDLTVKRLSSELTFDELLKYAETNRKSDQHGCHRPFYDAREGQTDKATLASAALFRNPESLNRAKRRADRFLAPLMPPPATGGGETRLFAKAVGLV